MKYLSGEKPALRDLVVGRDKGGHPIGGQVIETNAKGEVLVSPAVHNATWAKAEEVATLASLDKHLEPVPASDEATKQEAGKSET